MCEVNNVPKAIHEFAVGVAQAELDNCQAFFQTPKGNLRGKIVLEDGRTSFEAEGSEEIKAYAAQCRLHLVMTIKATLVFPDGTKSCISRYPRYPGDVEGMPEEELSGKK